MNVAASYAVGTGSFPEVKRPGCGVDHPPHLAPRLKKEQSYISTPPLDRHGRLQGEVYLYFNVMSHLQTVRTVQALFNCLCFMRINPSRTKRNVFYLNTQSVPRSKHSISVIKTSQLMLYKEIIAVCSENHTKHINALCGSNILFFSIKPGGI